MTALDYNQLAAEYARHRRPYPGLVEFLAELAGVDGDSAVLEMGCGTANHLAALQRLTGARALGVDPFPEMLKAAAGHEAELELRTGRAEDIDALDLPEASFDLIFSVDMIHYVREPHRYFEGALRALKPGGVLCTATDSEEIIRTRVPVAEYFPSTVDVELGRHHAIEDLLGELRAAGFTDGQRRVFESTYELTDVTKYREKAFSSLHLIPDEEFTSGVAALTARLAEGPLLANNRTCAVLARRPE
ncbi:class I SAM-dependent methyltransferase [Streptomyces eurocidicus]|uniref:SAM-dependent methyltransferase n=1 Tax=Streptomyces eurocidicus TaxID=66423 RepID=A0A7W8F5T0_STREU|nr:class I SAM-dependent methyltransferase [Streptomyces eurocidicus]MBB5122270.1 SAM-dependent methyltransferase [Streptomyces eurocidicus]